MSITRSTITDATITESTVSLGNIAGGGGSTILQEDGLFYGITSDMGYSDTDIMPTWFNELTGDNGISLPGFEATYDASENAADLRTTAADVQFVIPDTVDYLAVALKGSFPLIFGNIIFAQIIDGSTSRFLVAVIDGAPDTISVGIQTNLETPVKSVTDGVDYGDDVTRNYIFFAFKNDSDPANSTFGMAIDGVITASSTYNHGTGFNVVPNDNFTLSERPGFVQSYALVSPPSTPANIADYISELNGEL